MQVLIGRNIFMRLPWDRKKFTWINLSSYSGGIIGYDYGSVTIDYCYYLNIINKAVGNNTGTLIIYGDVNGDRYIDAKSILAF